MVAKKGSPAGKQGHSEEQNKCTINSTIRKTAKALFMSGRKMTAVELNALTHSNDARKVISDLRRGGLKIQDIWLPNRRKLFWHVSDDRQYALPFQEGGES